MTHHKIDPPLKWHGGKAAFRGKLAEWIISHFPKRKSKENPGGYCHYVEPFAGGLSVLLANDPEGISEVANDIHSLLINFWSCLKSKEGYEFLQLASSATPFSEPIWQASREYVEYALKAGICQEHKECKQNAAFAFFIHCRQSMAGRMKSFAPLSKTRTRRGMNEQVSAWLSAIDGLPEVHARLKRVVLLCDDAIKVIDSEDDPHTLFYIDAPYVKDTRSSPNVYAYEMSNQKHEQLIGLLTKIQGRALVSMYHHPIYDALHCKYGWRLVEFVIPNNAASGDSKRRMVECLWMNYLESGTRV